MTNTPQDPRAAQGLLEAGLAASARSDSAEALALFGRAAAAAPGWALPHFLAGSEHASLGEWAQAEAALANAVLIDPALHIARYQLGLLQFSSGRAAVALVTWEPLLHGTTDPGLADFVRGFGALAQDDFGAAAQAFGLGLSRPGVNPAVAKDVKLVLDRMPGENAAAQSAENAQAAALPAHVLVANYGKFGVH